ncbi:hypothetical protein PAXRUDRAFT_159132, partial [Paxillus rubicundulus Ve08.2h10]
LFYLPHYLPDLNLIEESFSAYKAYLQSHAHQLQDNDDLMLVLLEACGCVTAETCKGWF